MTQVNIMALRHSAFYSPLLMAMAGGFLKEEGLDFHYELATPDKTVPGSIVEGTCDVAQSAVAVRLLELEKEAGKGVENNIVHFAQINARDGFFLVSREPDDSFEWRKLVGKHVLVDHFFQPLAMFKYALYKQGIDVASIEFINAGDVEAIDKAFRTGVGDYVHQQGPAPQQLQQEGIGYVVASVGDVIGPVAFSSLCASRAWCNSDVAGAFLRAYQKSLAYVREAPAEDIARQEMDAGFFPGINAAVLSHTITDYQALGCWEPEATISEAALQNLQDIFLYNKGIRRHYRYDELVVNIESCASRD